MRERAAVVAAVCMMAACSKKTMSPCDTEPLAGLIKTQPAAVLVAAADVVPGARAVADSAFVGGWESDEPGNLQERTNPGKLNAGIVDLCDQIDDLAPDERARAAAEIDAWVASYRAVDAAQSASTSVEYFATAVAETPELRAAIPASVFSPARRAVDPGETMASGEFSQMNYTLAHILSRMTPARRDSLLDDVRSRARAHFDADND